MNANDLFTNDEYLGSETYVGTRDEFRKELAPCFADWYKQDQDTELSLEEYIEDSLNKHLHPANEEDVADYPRITD